MAKIYLMAGRKAWHHDVPDGWIETHWERFDYIECGIYEKPDSDLADEDRDWVDAYSEIPDGWISPAAKRQTEEPLSGDERSQTAEPLL